MMPIPQLCLPRAKNGLPSSRTSGGFPDIACHVASAAGSGTNGMPRRETPGSRCGDFSPPILRPSGRCETAYLAAIPNSVAVPVSPGLGDVALEDLWPQPLKQVAGTDTAPHVVCGLQFGVKTAFIRRVRLKGLKQAVSPTFQHDILAAEATKF
ncbi:hypothetical protein BC628DRAFT_279137 [Trametes gibbosa]|nr:hypothetical protein BC628DRAFT_279137 [Trametes gibbosa]